MNRIPKIFLTISFTLAPLASLAVEPAFYSSLEGKSGDELVAAVRQLAVGHTRITYNTKTWGAFEVTDVRNINGRQCWRDMYSNNLVWLPAHDALNIEHSVANSWWGGKSGNGDAYADLFLLNPSDQLANNKKGNYPPGIVKNASILDNGLLRIGTPVEGQGGSANNVFEPADEYKGDFARAYFYTFTAYDNFAWDTNYAYCYTVANGKTSLQPWLAELLLAWHHADPVDSEEMNRNDRIEELQHNRNPFIDCPGLADCIWGDKTTFNLNDNDFAVVTDRPAAPVFGDCRMANVNTYTRRWWDGVNIPVNHEQHLMVSIDGGIYEEFGDAVHVDAASNGSASHTLRAYAIDTDAANPLRSSITTLQLNALDPDATDYSQAVWTRAVKNEDIATGRFGIILTSNTLHIMGTDGGTTATKFMQSAGSVEFYDDKVIELPVEAAIIMLDKSTDDLVTLGLYDTHGDFKGYWNATSTNQMKLDKQTATGARASIDEFGFFRLEFTQYGSLSFNKTQPRFLNYGSNSSVATPIYLYNFESFERPSTSTTTDLRPEPAITVCGNNIITPEGMSIYRLDGTRCSGANLSHGLYIVVGNGRSTKIKL